MRLLLCCFLLTCMAAGQDLTSKVRRDDAPLANPGTVVLSYRNAVGAARDSVVTIWVRHWKPRNEWLDDRYDLMPHDTRRPAGNGSGIVLTKEGLVMTNYHVVNGAQEIMLRARGSTEDIPAEIVGMDGATDVALLRAKSGTWQPATLTNSDATEPGDVVLALGSPFGLEQTVTLGIVSATGRAEIHGLASSLQDFIQTDAAINPGNSGGPLIDGLGRVIGMNTARYGGEGIGLAVPVNLALKVAEDLLKNGQVRRGFLGVRLVDVTDGVIAELKLGSAVKGAVVMQVEEGQPAAQAGLLPGDVITAVNGQAVTSRARFLMRMTTFQPGERVKLALTRNNEVQEVQVALIETPGTKPPPQALEWELLPGLRVVLVDEKLRNQLLLPKNFQALRALTDFKTADGTLKVAAGDFILRVNGRGVTRALEDSDEQYIERLRPKKPLVLLRLQQKSGAQTDVGFPLPAVK
ncbi:MAG: trypsin-like peptidase domain-containing protein [Prosthecobacter sp.]|uniref:S1C family serine protease n=1 Tax=Prosthecobacter sp. TaxID=1965333 RepID=UPI003BB0D268